MRKKHIHIKPIIKDEKKGRGGGGGKDIYKREICFHDKDYVESIKQIKEKSSFLIRNKKKFIFIIELFGKTPFFYIDDILKYLGGELIAFLSLYQLLIRVDENSLNKISKDAQKNKISKKYKHIIKSIRIMEPDEKLSYKIKEILKTSLRPEKVKIMGILMPKFDKEEYDELIKNLIKTFPEEEIVRHDFLDDSLLIFSAYISLSQIETIASKGYVYRISEEPEIKASPFKINEIESAKIKNIDHDLPSLCVIDTGINNKIFGNLILDYQKDSDIATWEDKENHGTSVSSVAIFGENILNNNSVLEPQCCIYAYKTDLGNGSYFHHSIMNAIKRYKGKTKIFNLSLNYRTYNQSIAYITNFIDNFVQKNNVILVNSCGNVPFELIKQKYNTYPDYIKNFSCKEPSIGKFVFSVGAYAVNDSEKTICRKGEISPYSAMKNRIGAIDNRIKPDIICRGGNMEIENGELIYDDPSIGMPILDNRGNRVVSIGTSFSAPYVSNLLASLAHCYTPIQNVETLKAILLSCASIEQFNGSIIFKLTKNKEKICFSDEDIIFFSEGILNPRIYDKETGNYIVNTHKIRFFVPPQTKYIRIVLVHSNDYEFSTPWMIDSLVKMSIHKGGRVTPLNENDAEKWFLNLHSPINFVEFKYKKISSAIWEIALTSRTLKGKSFKVRYGIAINLILTPMLTTNDESYQKIIDQLEPYII